MKFAFAYLGAALFGFLAILYYMQAYPYGSPADRALISAPSAVTAATEDLAERLDVSESSIAALEVEEVTWPDSCLGIQSAGQVCAQVLTPGYKILFSVRGKEYRYHTNESGSALYLVE